MPDPDGPVPPGQAKATRQAAALFIHWRRGEDDDVDGEMAVLEELATAEDWTDLVCALLTVGCQMAATAEDGDTDEYLGYVVREAMLAEVTS